MKPRILAALTAAAIAVVAVPLAIAAPPVHTSIAVAAQPTLWTNDYHSALQPVRFDCFGWLSAAGAADTVTVQRIRGLRTNTLATVTFTSGGAGTGWLSDTNYLYLVKDDVVRVTGVLLPTGTLSIVSTQP